MLPVVSHVTKDVLREKILHISPQSIFRFPTLEISYFTDFGLHWYFETYNSF